MLAYLNAQLQVVDDRVIPKSKINLSDYLNQMHYHQVKSGFVLLSRDAELISDALSAAAAVNIELRLLDEYPVISATEYLVADPKSLIDQPNLKPDLLISADLSDSLWRFAARYSPAQLIQLPDATSWFQSWLTNQHLVKSPLLGIRSIVAGAGASVLATAISFTAAQQKEVVLVDLDSARSSLRLLSTIETNDAVSWEQLTTLSGLPAASALFSGLPKLGKFRLLSFEKRNTELAPGLVDTVISLLQEQAQLVVIDHGPNSRLNLKFDHQIDLAPCNLLGLAKVKQLGINNPILRVIDKSGVSVKDAADYLKLNQLGSFKSDPKLHLDVADGVIPGERKKSELRKFAQEWLGELDG